MKDEQLQALFKKLPRPKPDASAKARAHHRASIAFRNAGRQHSNDAKGVTWNWLLGNAWAKSLSAIALVGIVVWGSFQFGIQQGQQGMAQIEADWEQDKKLLQELKGMFNGQLSAIVRTTSGTKILTSEQNSVFNSQPIAISIEVDGEKIHIISFSGERVTAKVGGKEITMDLLVGEDGKVIVAGEDFVWNSGQKSTNSRFKIKGKPLKIEI